MIPIFRAKKIDSDEYDSIDIYLSLWYNYQKGLKWKILKVLKRNTQ